MLFCLQHLSRGCVITENSSKKWHGIKSWTDPKITKWLRLNISNNIKTKTQCKCPVLHASTTVFK